MHRWPYGPCFLCHSYARGNTALGNRERGREGGRDGQANNCRPKATLLEGLAALSTKRTTRSIEDVAEEESLAESLALEDTSPTTQSCMLVSVSGCSCARVYLCVNA